MKDQAKKQEVTIVNEFGVPLYIDKKSKSQLAERVRLLKQVVATGKPIGEKKALSQKAIARAEQHIKWYAAELRNLKEGKSKSKAS